jgi:TetR/AcrR family fatty acid metabolism transcriptional regulator
VARERDEGKRQAILTEAKRLFAERGFHATSVADIVDALDMPVGTVYTYFENKDDIIRSALEEGWAGFYEALSAACAAEPSAAMRMSLIVRGFLPALFRDTELISLFLAEGLRYTDLNDKLRTLSAFIGGIIAELAAERGVGSALSPRMMDAALAVFFLGAMDAVRVSKSGGLAVTEADILAFIGQAVQASFGIILPELPTPPASLA